MSRKSRPNSPPDEAHLSRIAKRVTARTGWCWQRKGFSSSTPPRPLHQRMLSRYSSDVAATPPHPRRGKRKGHLRTCDSLEILSQPTFPASWLCYLMRRGSSSPEKVGDEVGM